MNRKRIPGAEGLLVLEAAIFPEKDKRTAPNTRYIYIYINTWY